MSKSSSKKIKSSSAEPKEENIKIFSKINFNFLYVVFILLLSVVNVIRAYPFLGTADGYTRWHMEEELIKNGKILQPTVLSSAIPLFGLITFNISGSQGLFTYLQTMLFYFGIGFLCFCVQNKNSISVKKPGFSIPVWILLSVMVVFLPTVGFFPLILSDSAFCFVSLVVMSWLLYELLFKEHTKRAEWILCPGLCFNSIFMVYLRPNAIIVVIGTVIFLLICKAKKKAVLTVLLLVSLFLGLNVNSLFVENHYSAENMGFMWELTDIAKNSQNQNLISEMNKFGDTAVAMSRFDDGYSNNLFWDVNPPYPVFSLCDKSNSMAVKELYLQTAFNQPADFIKTKLHFAGRVLGIFKPLLDDATRGIVAAAPGESETVRQNFISSTNSFSLVTRRPFFLFLLVLALILLKYFQTKIAPMKEIVPFIISVCYYGSFLINTQAHEFRYYAPAFFILLILTLSLGFDILSKIITDRRNQGKVRG